MPRTLLPGLAALVLVSTLPVGCDTSPTEPEEKVPARVQATTRTAVSATVAEAVPVAVRVTTDDGEGVPDAVVTFTVVSGNGAVATASERTGSDGTAGTTWTLGTRVGENVLTATVAGLPAVRFTASATPGPPAELVPFLGTDQVGPAGTSLPVAVAFTVFDAYRNPVPGVPVTIVANDGGEALGITEETGESGEGFARAWRLGPEAGPQTLRAQVGGVTLDYTATAYEVDSAFDIDLRFERETDFTESQLRAFEAAVTKVRSFITEPPVAISVRTDGFACLGDTTPAVDEVVDNPIVFVAMRDFETDPTFEGLEAYAGFGGVCAYRASQSDPDYRTSVLGRVVMNSRSTHDALGIQERTVVHELLHALGFGFWVGGENLRELVQGRGTDDPRFIGDGAVQAYGALPHNDAGAVPVPVQLGRADHWRLPHFWGELMAPAQGDGFASVSAVTVGALNDIGWSVDPAHADPYDYYDQFARILGDRFFAPLTDPATAGSDRAARAPPVFLPVRAFDSETGELVWRAPGT